MKRVLQSVVAGLLVMASTGCASRQFYHPDRFVYQTPAEHRLKYEDVTFTSRDGTRLHGWFLPAVGKPVGTVIHFHGNAQNLTAHFSFVDWLPSEGFNLFTFDYRGYGQSEGHPSRRGVYEDTVAAIEYVKTRKDIDQDRLFIFGQSLGGANVLPALANHEFDGIRAVAIESTFYSYRSMTRDVIRRIPLLSLLRWPLSFVVVSNARSPGRAVDDISPIPLVLIHGTADRVIPYHHSQWLFKAAEEPKQFWTIEGGRHTEAFTRLRPTYRRKLVQFYKQAPWQ